MGMVPHGENAAPGREPLWQPRRRVPLARIPASLLPWLLDEGSLTRRVVDACPGPFRVRVVSQRWRRPMRNEALALGLRPQGRALVREVQLLCQEVAWVHARTVIPRATLSGRERRLAHLGSRSLGAVLFADPTLERAETELARLVPGDILYADIAAALDRPPAELWGRRTRFALSGKPLLVSEVFLPPIGEYRA
ncbi:chorismate--pyruvate lyase [Sulfurifustis variabilis]|uniref:Probable chorismate pyruvate-lyase n=2 Tax=Sulfurifustis variabilis TaxID=1675686 RepID=A0A1B4VA61_9GAMM|nr:chorismate--pyruvate lyase [Sulfurifustis variabilis]